MSIYIYRGYIFTIYICINVGMWLVLLLVVVCNLPEALLMYKLASKVMNYIDRSCSSPAISTQQGGLCS